MWDAQMGSGMKKGLKIKTSSAFSCPYLFLRIVRKVKPPTAPAQPHNVSKQSAELVTVFLIQINDPIQPCLLSMKLESVGRSK